MSLLNDIIDWVESKPKFWQVAIDRLIRNNELTDIDINELTEIAKTDFGLSTCIYNDVDFDSLREFALKTTKTEDIVVSKIFNIDNINALSKSSELLFNAAGLTVVYGDNGSGKSSFVSILKHVCKTRGLNPKINGNLFEPTSYSNDRKAEVEYTIDGKTFSTVNLLNENVNDLSLKSVDVFDSFSANHYIEGEDEIAFIPHGLAIVEKFAGYLKKIENNLTGTLSHPSLTKFDYFLLEVSDDSSAKTFLKNLNARTTLDELRLESRWSSSKDAHKEVITDEIQALKNTDPIKKIKANEEKIKRFEILQKKYQTLENKLAGQFVIDLQEQINIYASTHQALLQASADAFSGLPIEGVGNSSWKLLWESARKFYNESVQPDSFPETKTGSSCPLCLQDLEESARKRFNDFEDFVKNDIQKTFDEAATTLELSSELLNALDLLFDDQQPTIIEVEELVSGFIEKHESYVKELGVQKEYLTSLLEAKAIGDEINSISKENTPKTVVSNQITELKKTNEKLKIQSIEEELKPLEKELNQLKGEKKLYDHKPKLAREIYRQKKISLINQCIGKCSTRVVTSLSNDLATKYIGTNLKQNFRTELNNLGFKNIKIETETKGQKGKQYHYLRLDEQPSANVSLKEILSEGEHRCISLATFLSELSISDHKSAIIFDDPVCSLDHKWRYKISKRIVEESMVRQVIVFTHDITFLLMLQEFSRELSCTLDIKSLTRKKNETGLIASNPPWDALSVGKRIGALKSAHQQLAKIEKTEPEDIYKEKAKVLYGKLRETWERFVEEVFLNGAIQRFGREIQTQRLAKIVDLTPEDYALLDYNMGKCSTYFTGHDTSGALIEEMPDSAEVLSDIGVLETCISEIRKRRK